jgi:hypothetical protein
MAHYVSERFQSSGIVNTRKHNVSETGSIFLFRRGEGDTYSIAGVANPNDLAGHFANAS